MRCLSLTVVAMSLVGCLNLTLPPAPQPPGPGTVQGRLVYAVPGRTEVRPAGGADVTLLGTSESTLADAETGRFLLGGIRAAEGQVLVRFDLDGDGSVDRQRLLELKAFNAGPGRDVELGDVALARNASLIGQVLRGDNPLPRGHAGTTVFVPEAPYLTTTADDGSFLLNDLPEGPISVAFFRDGFDVDGREVQLVGGQEARLSTVTLVEAPPGTAVAQGVVSLAEGGSASGARVRFAAAGLETAVTAGDDGRFTASGLRPSLYQVAIERAGAQSVRLFNVLLVNGDNDLGAVSLVAGTSESISLDGGIVPGSSGLDAGPPPIAALISPSISDAAPGANVVLSGARSTGVPPLTYRWRFDTDGGAVPAFSFNDATSAVNGVFTAPATSAVLPVELTVVDALQRVSAPARAVVRVGQAPLASLMAMGSTSITGGDQVTLLGTGSTSPDGRPIVVYRWRQVTGPPVPEIELATGAQVTFTAPSVIGPTPLTVELAVTTDIGLTSAAASVTLVLSPPRPWDVSVQVSPAGGGTYGPDGGSVVRLTAAVSNPPGDAGFTYSWTPAFEGCGQPDGGVDLSCSSAFALSNPTSAQTEFVTPRTDGIRVRDFTVTVRNTADGSERTVRTVVNFRDARPPDCMLHLTPLALRVTCDEAIGDAGIIDLGPTPPAFTVVKSSSQVSALMMPPQTVGTQLTVSVQGLVDQAGNAAAPIGGTLTVMHEYGPISVSTDTSTDVPRPRWVTLAGPGQPASSWIVGRRVSNGNRGLWAIDGNAQCFTPPCNAPTLPASSATIPGAGSAPPLGDIVAAVGDRAYVIVSPNSPVHLAEGQGNQGREVMGAPAMVALAADSQGLQVVATTPTPGANGGLQPLRYQPATGQFTQIDMLSGIAAFSPSGVVRLELFSGAKAVLSAIDTNGDVQHFVTTGGPWSRSTLPVTVPSGVSELRAASLDDGQSTVFVTLASGNLRAFGIGAGGTWDRSLGNNVNQGFDLAPFGDAVALVASGSGRIQLAVLNRFTGTLTQVASNEMDGAWNGPVGASAWQPTLHVIDGQLAIAWYEGTAGNWKMAGRIVR